MKQVFRGMLGILLITVTAVVSASVSATELGPRTLKRFALVSPGIYRGSQPLTPADFQVLLDHKIKTIIDLETTPWNTAVDDANAAIYDIKNVYHTPIVAGPKAPNEQMVNKALAYLRQKDLQPIYVHCSLGRDRTSLIIGLHRVFNEGAAPSDALIEMDSFGFAKSPLLYGLRRYFFGHAYGMNPFGDIFQNEH